MFMRAVVKHARISASFLPDRDRYHSSQLAYSLRMSSMSSSTQILRNGGARVCERPRSRHPWARLYERDTQKCSVQHSGVHHPEGVPTDLDAMAHSFSFGMMTMIGPLVDVEAASITFSLPRFLHVLCCVSVCVSKSFDGGIRRGAVRLERRS